MEAANNASFSSSALDIELVGEGNLRAGGGIRNGVTFSLGLKLFGFLSDSVDLRVSSQPDLNGSWTAFGGAVKGTMVTLSNCLIYPKKKRNGNQCKVRDKERGCDGGKKERSEMEQGNVLNRQVKLLPWGKETDESFPGGDAEMLCGNPTLPGGGKNPD